MKNLIIDCETLGIKDNAVVPMFAALVTDSELSIKDNFKNMTILHPSISEQKENGRTVDEGTLAFWDGQPSDVREIVMSQGKALSVNVCFDSFKEFLNKTGYTKENHPFIWQRGSKDLEWLTTLFAPNDLGLPWWSVRDIRTAIDVLGASTKQNGYMDADKVSDEGTSMLMKLNESGKQHHPAYDVVRDFIFLRTLGLV